MKSIRCLAAMRRGIGQGIDDLQLLDDGAGPSVRDDEWQRAFVLRANAANTLNQKQCKEGRPVAGPQKRLVLSVRFKGGTPND